MGVLLGGWLDGVVARNQVTSYLMAITVIKVGVVHFYFFVVVLMRRGGWSNAIREVEGGGGR